MPFDTSVWEKPSVGGEVSGIAIETTVALRAVSAALGKLAAIHGVDISVELSAIEDVAEGLHTTFNSLSGWINPDDA